jgi:hypothetical protein
MFGFNILNSKFRGGSPPYKTSYSLSARRQSRTIRSVCRTCLGLALIYLRAYWHSSRCRSGSVLLGSLRAIHAPPYDYACRSSNRDRNSFLRCRLGRAFFFLRRRLTCLTRPHLRTAGQSSSGQPQIQESSTFKFGVQTSSARFDRIFCLSGGP